MEETRPLTAAPGGETTPRGHTGGQSQTNAKRKRASPNSSRRILSIGVGFRVIRFLVEKGGYRSLKEISAATNMPPAKVHNYLASFIWEGMVDQDVETGHYGLGPFATMIGLAAIREHDVIGLCAEPIDTLCAATGCAAYVSVWGDLGPVIAYRKDGDRQGSLTIRTGHVMPLLFSGTGHVFLAYLPSHVTDKLIGKQASDPMGISPSLDARSARRRAREIKAAVRARGMAISAGAANPGFYALAAPIFDHGGGLAAALAVLGPAATLSEAGRKRAQVLLRELATQVSARLGYQGDLRSSGQSAR